MGKRIDGLDCVTVLVLQQDCVYWLCVKQCDVCCPGDPRIFTYLHALLAQCAQSSVPALVPSYTCLLPPGGLQHTLLAGQDVASCLTQAGSVICTPPFSPAFPSTPLISLPLLCQATALL